MDGKVKPFCSFILYFKPQIYYATVGFLGKGLEFLFFFFFFFSSLAVCTQSLAWALLTVGIQEVGRPALLLLSLMKFMYPKPRISAA